MKWGILATGTIAEKFADTVNHMEQEDETLIACASRNLEHGKAFASKYGIPKVYGSYAQMMTDSEVDAVYIATPNSLHYENCRMWPGRQENMYYAKSQLPFVWIRQKNCTNWQRKKACLLWKLSGSGFCRHMISCGPC